MTQLPLFPRVTTWRELTPDRPPGRYSYTVVWHDAGCIIKRSDGKWLHLTMRYSQAEVDGMTEAQMRKLPGQVDRGRFI